VSVCDTGLRSIDYRALNVALFQVSWHCFWAASVGVFGMPVYPDEANGQSDECGWLPARLCWR
jgi:hypothetical protein